MPRTGWRKRTPWPRCDCLPPQFDAGGCGTHRPRLLIHTATPLTQWPTGTDGGHHPQTPWREAPTSAARTRRLHSHTQARLLHHRSLRVETRHPRHRGRSTPPRTIPAPPCNAGAGTTHPTSVPTLAHTRPPRPGSAPQPTPPPHTRRWRTPLSVMGVSHAAAAS